MGGEQHCRYPGGLPASAQLPGKQPNKHDRSQVDAQKEDVVGGRIAAEQGFEKLEAENVKRAPVVGGHGRKQRLLAQGCERGHCDV
ncbi:hypothetical protein [Candidatus Amarobacter glycogenicus]|uniref:hypothetical protein n=1 Tax=Candidatus Amarobacter glycogenicus TaxID=3140699 RepID=UPI003136CB5A|nr:hypothetical protein [Dehalococcoidia bacterium]